MQIFKLAVLYLPFIRCTIDLNLSELQYLADHLHPEECRRLVAALHFKSYQQPNALDQAEAKVSKDIPCIRLLLHWNSAAGEGKGETHEVVQHRLRQLGRTDLADWLGKTVFHELGEEMIHSMDDPFASLENITQKHKHVTQASISATVATWDPTEWVAFDTICWVFVVGLSLITLAILGRVICMLAIKRKRKRRKLAHKSYNQLETEDGSMSESEDRFDIRTHEGSALKLMALSPPERTEHQVYSHN